MFTKFWDKMSEGLAQAWVSRKMSLALAFWIGGALAWIADHGWKSIAVPLARWNSAPAYIALAIGGLMLLAASAAIVAWLQLPAIRLAEGYWPGPFRRLRFKLAKRLEKSIKAKDARWNELAPLVKSGAAGPEARDEYARLDAELSRYPADPADLMPTTLGNLLRAAEEHPYIRYGLAISVCWPRLWLLLPADTRQEISDARERLNAAARLTIWGLLFFIWMIWSSWAAVPASLLLLTGYARMLGAAVLYGDLLRAAFDLHRFSLYESLRLPLPEDPGTETEWGKQLTEYLFRGAGGKNIRFTFSGNQGESSPGM